MATDDPEPSEDDSQIARDMEAFIEEVQNQDPLEAAKEARDEMRSLHARMLAGSSDLTPDEARWVAGEVLERRDDFETEEVRALEEETASTARLIVEKWILGGGKVAPDPGYLETMKELMDEDEYAEYIEMQNQISASVAKEMLRAGRFAGIRAN